MYGVLQQEYDKSGTRCEVEQKSHVSVVGKPRTKMQLTNINNMVYQEINIRHLMWYQEVLKCNIESFNL